MCSVNLGEALYMEIRVRGLAQAGETIESARRELTILDPDWDLVVAAAKVKASGGLSYADAFCVATAERLNAVLWTGDPEIVGLAQKLPCEVHDLRPARLSRSHPPTQPSRNLDAAPSPARGSS